MRGFPSFRGCAASGKSVSGTRTVSPRPGARLVPGRWDCSNRRIGRPIGSRPRSGSCRPSIVPRDWNLAPRVDGRMSIWAHRCRIDSIKLYPENPADFPARFTRRGIGQSAILQSDDPGRSIRTGLCAERKRSAGISGQRRNVPLRSTRHPSLLREKGLRCPANGSHVRRQECGPDEVHPGIWNRMVARARAISLRRHALTKRRGHLSARCLPHHRRASAAQVFFDQ